MAESNGQSSKFLDWRWLAGLLLVILLAVVGAWAKTTNEGTAQTWINKTNIEAIREQLSRIEGNQVRVETKVDRVIEGQRSQSLRGGGR